MRQFGLIGKTLKHSFSKNYFSNKFIKENIEGCNYELFELPTIQSFPKLIEDYKNSLLGLNVTIPYKLDVMEYLDELDSNAKSIGAVNTIKVLSNGKLKGYNTDYLGFKNSLKENWELKNKKALILGTGGASNAVKCALGDLQIDYLMVSRSAKGDIIDYESIMKNPEIIEDHKLIVNTTPLGTFPNVEDKPQLPYSSITENHLLFDLVYNPEVTAFMKEGLKLNAKVKNGYNMLVGQAEASWKIWNE
ncbi:shikimate dehydrogenase family protein [Reichenbachiella versicolor]|uniref:shikimate dehydrogenase family protein n=1 Tax=Reichenbachiella versicolor TaxID=1821036 RepID=UPI000D6DF5C6|nr:shikimate dehydrogenase [Reichenbachiella versicolor]